MIKILLIGAIIFITSKFITKFFKEYKFHNSIVKYFDFIFIVNLPYFFILLGIFFWGMSLSYYQNLESNHDYFSFNFSYQEIIFFIGFIIFLSAVNIKTRLDNLIILKDWGEKPSKDIYNQKYKKNLNHLYVSPNFVSPNSANIFLKVYFLIGSLLILLSEPKCFPLLLIYSIINFYFNSKLIKNLSLGIFVLRCLFVLFMLFLLFFSGWIYFDGLQSLQSLLNLLSYSPLFLLAIILFALFKTKTNRLQNMLYSLLAFLWIGLLFQGAIYLRNLPEIGFNIVLCMFLSVWMTDSFAYIFGSKFGRAKILPSISPNKTWVGCIAGYLSCTVFIYLLYKFNYFTNSTYVFSLKDVMILGIISGIFGQAGDFFESYLKRSFSIKDSGTLLQGHGGFLDRFDSLLFVVPMFTYYYYLIL